VAKSVKFDRTSFDFGANVKPKKSGGGKAKGGAAKRKPSGIRVWKGRTFGS
jgi:hypothetical protein